LLLGKDVISELSRFPDCKIKFIKDIQYISVHNAIFFLNISVSIIYYTYQL